MKFTIFNIKFNYKLLPSLIFTIFFILFIKLGFWQLDRADQKKMINAVFAERQKKPPIQLNSETILLPLKDIVWYSVIIRGKFLNDKNIILDNQILDGKAGYLIYTPFKILDLNKTILVNRGWFPVSNFRSDIPNIAAIEGTYIIEGEISKMPTAGIRLREVFYETVSKSTYRLQNMEYDNLSSLVGKDLLNYVVKLKKPIFDKNFILVSSPPVSDSDKNYGYAFQWFAMALTLLVIFIRLGIKRK